PARVTRLLFRREESLPVHEEIVSSKASERRRFVGLEPRRVDLIVAGSTFLATAFEVFEFDEMTISEWSLREGILLDVIGHHDPADWSEDPRAIRRASVQGLARRGSTPQDHSRPVAPLPPERFHPNTGRHGLDAHGRELLKSPAPLRAVGGPGAHAGLHRHAASLV